MKWLLDRFRKRHINQGDAGRNTIVIIGLYKCGTSWLSSALAAHPEAMALHELDVLRAFSEDKAIKAKSVAARIKYILTASSYGWLPAEVTEKAASLPQEAVFDFLEKNVPGEIAMPLGEVPQCFERASGREHIGKGCGYNHNLTYWHLDEASARQVINDTIFNPDVQEAVRNFCRIHQEFSGKHLVLKSADLINRDQFLRALLPNAKQVLIVRDGRDMVISASKFEQFIQAKTTYGQVWRVGNYNLWERLAQWSGVMRKAKKLEKQGHIYLLRYEDLLDNFDETLERLLKWAGLDASPEIIERIKQETTFEKMSGGRARGNEDIGSNIRKGMAGEWRDLLSEEEKEKAWKIAGRELAEFGYQRQ